MYIILQAKLESVCHYFLDGFHHSQISFKRNVHNSGDLMEKGLGLLGRTLTVLSPSLDMIKVIRIVVCVHKLHRRQYTCAIEAECGHLRCREVNEQLRYSLVYLISLGPIQTLEQGFVVVHREVTFGGDNELVNG